MREGVVLIITTAMRMRKKDVMLMLKHRMRDLRQFMAIVFLANYSSETVVNEHYVTLMSVPRGEVSIASVITIVATLIFIVVVLSSSFPSTTVFLTRGGDIMHWK